MKKKKTSKILPIEKILIFIIVMLAFITPVSIVYYHASLSKSNIEVERIRSKVNKKNNSIQGLSMQVDELASLSNIQEIAKKYGLSYNNNNIIVITKDKDINKEE